MNNSSEGKEPENNPEPDDDLDFGDEGTVPMHPRIPDLGEEEPDEDDDQVDSIEVDETDPELDETDEDEEPLAVDEDSISGDSDYDDQEVEAEVETVVEAEDAANVESELKPAPAPPEVYPETYLSRTFAEIDEAVLDVLEKQLNVQPIEGNKPHYVTLSDAGGTYCSDKLDLGKSFGRGRVAKRIADVLSEQGYEITKDQVEVALLFQVGGIEPAHNGKLDSNLESLDPQDYIDNRAFTIQAILDDTDSEIVEEAKKILRGNVVSYFVGCYNELGATNENVACVTCILAALSRVFEKPVWILFRGKSGSGKSFLMSRTAIIMPPELILIRNDITPQAMYYMKPQGRLCHTVLFNGERSQDGEFDHERTKVYRDMYEEGIVHKEVTTPDKGSMKTETYTQLGPISLFQGTTASKINPENLNRCLVIHTRGGKKHIKKILARKAAEDAGEVSVKRFDPELVHTIIRLLKPYNVVIPFAKRLNKLLDAWDDDYAPYIRLRGMFSTMLKTAAYLRQYHKKVIPPDELSVDPLGTIEVDAEDYRVVCLIMESQFRRVLGLSVSDSAAKFGRAIYAEYESGEFRVKDVPFPDVPSKSERNKLMKELQNRGYAELVSESNGVTPAIWRMIHNIPDGTDFKFPSKNELLD